MPKITQEDVTNALNRMRMNADDERINAQNKRTVFPKDLAIHCEHSVILDAHRECNKKKRGKFHPYRNSLEKDYAAYLALMHVSGLIAAWEYEAVKFKIGEKRCWWTPDFMVIPKSHPGFPKIEFHETKGFMRQHARVKIESAKLQYPMFCFVTVYRDKGGWRYEG